MIDHGSYMIVSFATKLPASSLRVKSIHAILHFIDGFSCSHLSKVTDCKEVFRTSDFSRKDRDSRRQADRSSTEFRQILLLHLSTCKAQQWPEGEKCEKKMVRLGFYSGIKSRRTGADSPSFCATCRL